MGTVDVKTRIILYKTLHKPKGALSYGFFVRKVNLSPKLDQIMKVSMIIDGNIFSLV